MNAHQHTIAKEAKLSGTGLHTGVQVSLNFKPAEANHGIVFKRIDLEDQPEIPALARYVVNTERGTTIGVEEARVSTVEHVLAALAGLQIDNCLIEIDGIETPIMDGSARPFVEVLEEAGLQKQEALRNFYEVTEPITLLKEEEGVELMVVPATEYQVSVMVDYGTKVLGSQNAALKNIESFKQEIASCRTFSFLHELEFLLDHGLIKGGDLNNAIVYVDREVEGETLKKLQKAFKKKDVTVKQNGILDNLELHYPNEAARHKLLDVIGDLSLLGRPIKGRLFATRPGHKANVEFAQLLTQRIKEDTRKAAVPRYNPDQKPVYDVNQIMSILPHRPPFLLVDKILELSEEHVVGLKSVTMNEPFFEGHFPGAPVMPGVLQVEAMAQAGGILALSTVEDPENYLTYFLRIDNVKFKRQVIPGDTLIFNLQLSEPIRRGIVKMKGQIFMGSQMVCEAAMMAQIVKKRS